MSVLKAIEFPNQEFKTKEELFFELKKYKETLINLKKTAPFNSVGQKAFNSTNTVETIKGLPVDEGFIYAVINTTKVLDSHNDVHLNGIWNKTVEEQQGKIFYVADHDLSVKSVIAFPQDVEMFLKEVSFKELGENFEGNTQALIFKIAKENIKLKEARDIIENKTPIENSVRMQYVKIDLAIDSTDPELTEEKAVWDNIVGVIANKETAVERGYFWAVKEAAISKEGSMVLMGSNSVTPLLQSKDIEPPQGTHEDEPLGTHKEEPQPKNGGGKLKHIFI